MSKPVCITKNPLQRDGTSRRQRMLEALDPAYAPLHEYGLREWMRFAWQYAARLNYFSTAGDPAPQGDWTAFMPSEAELEVLVNRLRQNEAPQTLEPHLALFVCFIKLLQPSLEMMNGLTARHLNFYYEEILKIERRPPQPDKVHLMFTLAKNMVSHQLEADTRFDAGKDNGKPALPLEYGVPGRPVIYRAAAASFKSVFHKTGQMLTSANMANSADGNGAPLDKNNPLWYAFGTPGQQVARPGFALASQVLMMQEGERTITVTLDMTLPATADYSVFNNAANKMTVLITGEKGWITAAPVTINQQPASGSGKWVFTVVIGSAEKAITGWNKKLHKENYNTENPVMRVLFEASSGRTGSAYDLYSLLAVSAISQVSIKVNVKGLRSLDLENDDGKLDAARPFLPFGPIPKKGSDFFVGSAEIFSKPWTDIQLNLTWKNKPADLKAHYYAYRSAYINSNKFSPTAYLLRNTDAASSAGDVVTGDSYFKVKSSFVRNGAWSAEETKELFSSSISVLPAPKTEQKMARPEAAFKQIFSTEADFSTAYVKDYLLNRSAKRPFILREFDPGFEKTETAAVQANAGAAAKSNGLRLRLETDFLHAHYPALYAAALIVDKAAVIPKEPYTPLVESLVIDYTAEEMNQFNISGQPKTTILSNYRQRKIQLFHEAPFGQSEQHIFLKQQQEFIANKQSVYMAPAFEAEGGFYIGIDSLAPETILSMLFQVAEGSENPLSPGFADTEGIQWHILCGNEWKYLNNDFILSDDTGNLLRPGIIQFLIPAEATNGNTVLPEAYWWLRAQLPPGLRYDSVCRMADVLAQAQQAVFINNGNELSHLATALPAATISKMTVKQAAVKTVQQPFSSFGGRGAETDMEYYMRVSERLRHKNRAVNIWDYERLVLQRFPDVYKVKCLNHTSAQYEMEPGYVRIIPIPDLRNRNIYNKYQPRVSRNTLAEINQYLAGLTGFHVNCRAENPDFEEVLFELNVKFRDGYDPRASIKQLNEDLKQYLSPWAYNTDAAVNFGGALHKSHVIAFAEERGYVDFITDFKMYNLGQGRVAAGEITAGSSRAILTTASAHLITAIQPPVC